MRTSIGSEQLAAYAEGNISVSERTAVRQYLTDHPDELETVMIMMDEDLDLDLASETEVTNQAPTADEGAPNDILHSLATFAPQLQPKFIPSIYGAAAAFCSADRGAFRLSTTQNCTARQHQPKDGGFLQRIDDLISDIDS